MRRAIEKAVALPLVAVGSVGFAVLLVYVSYRAAEAAP